MRSEIIRGAAYQAQLKDFVGAVYGLRPRSLQPAKRGYYAETWKLEADEGRYFLKLDFLPHHQERFRNSLAVMEALRSQGIDFIGRVIPTRLGALSARFGSAVLGVMDWIDGENVETDATKSKEYALLCRVYTLPQPTCAMELLSFSDETAERFYRLWEALKAAPSQGSNAVVLGMLDSRREELARYARRLAKTAARCGEDTGDFYITHGDAGGNFFVGGGRNYILDWDEVMYAPLERDAWVMGCHAWARKLFDDTLRANHIAYRLRMERLAFFCYHMFFLYLGEFLLDQPSYDMSGRIDAYFRDGWIERRLCFADQWETAWL